MTRLLALLLAAVPAAGQDSLLAVFWNLENFFDYRSEAAPQFWTRGRFYAKCDAVAKTLMLIADRYGRLPDIAAFAEIENSFVMHSLVSSTLLRKLGYSAVHFESPDHRGIDCGLIYRKSVLELLDSYPKHVYDSSGAMMATRDIVVAEFGGITVLVNHHPSRIGGKSDRREAAMERMLGIADSLRSAGRRRVLAVGDFNDELWPSEGSGTLKYNGRWEKIDGHFSFGALDVDEKVFVSPLLLVPDKAFGGMKPRRCFTGPRYEGGISDHLPIVLEVSLSPL
ncbi:MAG TPA: hypothetical protein IAC86_00520 [Candidatus Cryptobacteroides excrementigallinarum]|nr:hypothetical protein [Candidatus Cryptobacteroides excrementigallinarum]